MLWSLCSSTRHKRLLIPSRILSDIPGNKKFTYRAVSRRDDTWDTYRYLYRNLDKNHVLDQLSNSGPLVGLNFRSKGLVSPGRGKGGEK